MPRIEVISGRSDRLNSKKIQTEIERELDKIAREAKDDFDRTQRTWDHQAQFVIRSAPGIREVKTTERPYVFVDFGTKPHVIRPKNANALAFNANSKAKTRPGVLTSGPGAPGNLSLVRKSVKHPGSKAREFSKMIAEKWNRQFKRRMDEAIARGLK